MTSPSRFAAICGLALLTLAAGHSDPSEDGPVNRLAAEASPYLQLHKHNPVDWYPWGEEAFARAREEDKPVFLSVGYSTCYWCHVMEREVFSNPDIAALMNEHFVSVKVDREERPDIDEIYLTATQLMTGSAGWPNSVFLTPDGAPFYAGTYFPPEDSGRRPGFPRVLRQLADAWSHRREEVLRVAAQTRDRIAVESQPLPAARQSFDPKSLLARAADELAGAYDPEYGGFSRRTKFPSPPKLELLLAAHAAGAHPRSLEMLTHTLDEMALGGLYDQVGGGFHRYSTERTWSIPHFEKMLYDNAQLIGVYARAWKVTGREHYRQVVVETVRYLEREMRDPAGGFYSAQDAEVDGEEGRSYLWNDEQLQKALGGKRAARFLTVYRLAPMPDAEGGALRVRLPLPGDPGSEPPPDAAARLAPFAEHRARLLQVRSQRKQPLRDDKVLASWNGLAIRGLVDAASALDRPEYLALARGAADFALAHLQADDGRLSRSYVAGQVRESAVVDDYAYLADGLLALHAAGGTAADLAEAARLADETLLAFEDPEAGGFFMTPPTSELFTRPRVLYDDVLPSGAAVALRVLRTLARLTGEARFVEAAQRTAASFGGAFEQSPLSVATAVVELSTGAPAPQAVAASRPALPHSADHVEVAARRLDDDELAVDLVVADGWHINANPASQPFLIATTVELADSAARVDYPAGEPFRPAFSPDTLSTYRGRVEIRIRGIGSRPANPISVRYQACDETRCLPPSTTQLPFPPSPDP